MTNTAEQLLAAVAPLPHAARLRFTAVTARRLADRGELAPLLAELVALGPYERRLAALAALTGGDVPHLAARLADPDPVVRRYALRGARRLPVPDRAVEAAYDDAPAVVRADLARLLCEGTRPELAERLVPRLRAEYGEGDAARLLPGCSTEFAARMLPELADAVPFEGWGRLGGRHPLAVLDHADRELAGLPYRWRDAWWARHATGIGAAVPAAPERVLELLERHGPDTLPGPVYDRLDLLVAVDAERVTRWLADRARHHHRWERTPSRGVLRRLAAAEPPSLARLASCWVHREAFTILLTSTPPSRRRALAEAAFAADPRRAGSALRDSVVHLLPASQRRAAAAAKIEARRGAEGLSDWDYWWALAFMPPSQARPELLAALPGADVDDREGIWSALVRNAGSTRDAAVVAEIMTLAASRLGNERDSVRGGVLDDFVRLPGALLVTAMAVAAGAATADGAGADGAAPTAGPVERLCLDGLEARDCSPLTRGTIRDLALALLDCPAEEALAAAGAAPYAASYAPSYARRTAVRILEALTAHTGTAELGALERTLRAGREDAVLEALLPWLDRAADRGDAEPLVAVAEAFGRRVHRIPELQDRLARALRSCSDTDFPRVAALWLGDRATRGERVAQLLEQEPSAAHTAPVLGVLAAERTDLLDRVLVETQPPGRFPLPGAARALPDLRYAARWLPRQQEAAVRLVRASLGDESRGLDERAALLRAVASVPEHGPALVRQYLPSAKPGGLPVEPGGLLVEPGGGSVESGGGPVEPGGGSVEPGGLLVEPGGGSVEPGGRPAEPGGGPVDPGVPVEPGGGPVEPGAPVGPGGVPVEPVFVRAALEASAHGYDPAEALATLLDHAGTDGASTAWAAAGRVANRARPSLVTALLRDLLTRESGVKVTVRKSAARLAALHLPREPAAVLLAATARDPRTHPDVRAAVSGQATSLLPAPGAWEILEAVVADGPAAARKEFLGRKPLHVPAPHRPRYAALAARLAVVEDREVAAVALYALADWAWYAPEATAVLGDLWCDLSVPADSVQRAQYSLRVIAGSELPHPVGGAEPGSVLHGVVNRLMEIVAAGESQDSGGRRGVDLPARRRLESLLGGMSGSRGPARLYGSLARQLADVPALTSLRASLLVEAVDLTAPPREVEAALREIAHAAQGRPVLAGQLARDLHAHHRYGDALDAPESVLAAVAAMGEGLAEGLLAVALASAIGLRQDWPDPCRGAVLALRDHPEQEVRDAAYAVVVGST
ncbi:hypothetical protein OG625_16265 [Streptomyces sp. NBC_01351]|uniref:hypothetical protein n=1 Tax=Streptomyces sp. NBC_01351 TaxID=2903833 RepID=UPI002E367C2C|nr:hypothetical protein [Streptomyces sp. NBC_01351]